jgi:hypothetical protein
MGDPRIGDGEQAIRQARQTKDPLGVSTMDGNREARAEHGELTKKPTTDGGDENGHGERWMVTVDDGDVTGHGMGWGKAPAPAPGVTERLRD